MSSRTQVIALVLHVIAAAGCKRDPMTAVRACESLRSGGLQRSVDNESMVCWTSGATWVAPHACAQAAHVAALGIPPKGSRGIEFISVCEFATPEQAAAAAMPTAPEEWRLFAEANDFSNNAHVYKVEPTGRDAKRFALFVWNPGPGDVEKAREISSTW